MFETLVVGMDVAGAHDVTCADIVLLSAVMIGHAEGRPMTCGKLSAYVGMPRATVFRRLQEMMSAGIIRHDARKRWTFLTTDPARRDLIDSVIVANAQHVRKAMAALSKMDGLDVADRREPPLRTLRSDTQ
jgi:predicted transcriptional regulator